MENWDPKALAFSALQRLWVADEPSSAENLWQKKFEFMRLSELDRSPNHWYKHEGESGYIQYYPSGDAGQFHKSLPSGIDPSLIVEIPRLKPVISIYDRMKGLLLKSASEENPAVKAMIADWDELRGSYHAARIRSSIAGDGSEAYRSGPEAVAGFLSKRLNAASVEELGNSRITGFEVAALMLFESLNRQLSAAGEVVPANLFGKMFDGIGVPSLPQMVSRFIHDCFSAGLGNAATEAFEQIRKGGDTTLSIARSKTRGDLYPGLYLDSYYNALQQAGIRFNATRWAYLSALTSGRLQTEERKLFEKRANAAEEKLVRMNSALMYAVEDLDGTRFRNQQQQIRLARKGGDEKKVSAILGNIFDSQMFYPQEARKDLLDGV